MRSIRTGFWLGAFLLGASVPAFCQIVVIPNGSGRVIPANSREGVFQETVYTTGAVDVSLSVLRNSTLRFTSSATISTSGPSVNVSINVPLGQFGLTPGDLVLFVFSVRHRGTEFNTGSVVLSMIPVVPALKDPPPPPPTSTTRLAPPPCEGPGEVAARREDPDELG